MKRNLVNLPILIGAIFNALICVLFCNLNNVHAAKNPELSVLIRSGQIKKVQNEDEVRNAALVPITLLKQKGISQLAGVDLNELEKEFSLIHLFAFSSGFLISADGRDGALNFIEEKSIVLNSLGLSRYSARQQGLLLFHEFFSCLGYNDDEYSITVSFYLAAILQPSRLPSSSPPRVGQFTNSQNTSAPLYEATLTQQMSTRKTINKNTDAFKELSGGITGVGGGGDGFALDIKLEMLLTLLIPDAQRYLKMTASEVQQTFQEIMQMRITTTSEISHTVPDAPVIQILQGQTIGNQNGTSQTQGPATSARRMAIVIRAQTWIEHVGPIENSHQQIALGFLGQLKALH